MTVNEETLLAEKLVIFYGDTPINKPIDLRLRKNEIGLLKGGNGSGKTSVMRALIGQISSYLGEISIFGLNPRSYGIWKLIRAGLRIIPQFPIHPEFTTIEQYVKVFNRKTSANFDSKSEPLKSFLDIGEIRSYKNLGELSFGQRRLVDISLAVLSKPKLLLADEPTAALAPKVANFVSDQIHKYVRNNGAALIAVHKKDEELLSANWVVSINSDS